MNREGRQLSDTKIIELTAEIVANYVANNSIAVGDLPALIRATHDALAGVDAPVASAPEAVSKPTPAQIRKSITPDALISFEDGRPYKTLKRHLTTQGLTVAEYKSKWGLPADYPTTAPAYSEARSAMAKALGLGQGGRKAKTPPAKARAKKA
ncbi:transcriptional regulator [Caulobacter flavus]|uniref:Transcriptional regulator n=1 Tax=Caulobacter flavus TaxID=1679497 RepID=A0A2N5CQB7_9CAUL|nr:transcriptional regulator [Caulobacter flavus]PLR10002.1 transcriptional regulator [Caulobacter flavus]